MESAGNGTGGAQLGGVLALGLALRQPSWLMELHGTLRAPTALAHESDAGAVSVCELGFGGGVRMAWTSERIAIGGFAELRARWLSAEGETRIGTVGDSADIIPALMLGPEVGVSLFGWLRVRAATGVDVALGRQRFALNNQPVLDVGMVRGAAQLGLVATIW